jgi:hypothetical protein
VQNTTASRQGVHPFLQVFGAISNKRTYLDESWPPLFESPPSERREAYVELFGDFLFCQKILHDYLVILLTLRTLKTEPDSPFQNSIELLRAPPHANGVCSSCSNSSRRTMHRRCFSTSQKPGAIPTAS